MDAFFERLIVRAATIDELLSDDFEPVPGQKGDTERSARRLAAWCKACASGDWSLFARRLEKDNLSFPHVLERFASVRRRPSAPRPTWIDDAIWIVAAMRSPRDGAMSGQTPARTTSCPFEPLFAPVVECADALLSTGLESELRDNLLASARADLRHLLLEQLSGLCAAALYELFIKALKSRDKEAAATSRYGETCSVPARAPKSAPSPARSPMCIIAAGPCGSSVSVTAAGSSTSPRIFGSMPPGRS